LRSGYTPIIDTMRNVYRVIWKDSKKLPYGYIKENVFFAPIRKITSKKYKGYVYNLSVEKDNSYTTKSFVVHNCRGLHAEQNAFLQAACHGINVKGATIYCTNQPCIICTKMIINAGIKEVVIKNGYPDKTAREFFKKANIKLRRLKER
ncbi:MAG: deaminase, partial [Candidatus Omnitrophota bacterium]